MIFSAVISTEFLKMRRCAVTWATLIVYTFMIAVAGFFMWIVKNPLMAESLGLVGQKARLAFGGEEAAWSTFLTFVVQMGGVGGLIMSSFIATYVFGREYVEGTAKNLLALPVRRYAFVLAKVVVTAVWFGLLTLWMLPTAYVVGSMVGLTGNAADLFRSAFLKLAALYLMSLACSVLTAWVAVTTRGYFAPLGYAILTVMVSTVFGRTGWGPFVPWSIVGLYSGAAGPEKVLGPGSYAVVAATFSVGLALTIRHEVYADNTQ